MAEYVSTKLGRTLGCVLITFSVDSAAVFIFVELSTIDDRYLQNRGSTDICHMPVRFCADGI